MTTKRLLVTICLILLPCVLACGQGTIHAKVGWKAEDFFDDAKVVALCKAIEANDLKEMERLINDGANVNAKGKDNMTPLLWAFPDNKLERFKLLLEKGADPNIAIESDLNTRKAGFESGDSVTMITAKSGFQEHFRQVMDHGGDPNLVHRGNNKSLLQTVIMSGANKKERVELLIKKGADLNMDPGSAPPVIVAATFFGQYDLALFLLKSGADPNQYMQKENMKLVHTLINEKSRVEQSADPATKQAYESLVTWLKEHGQSFEVAQADLDRWESWRGKSFAEYRRLMDAEIAERKAREAAEKAKKNGAVGGEKKP